MATRPRRTRGRPTTFDREDALDVAVELFWRYGYEGVSIANLTEAIGIAPPSLYHAFGSKAGLYRAAVERYAASYNLFAAAEGATTARAAIEAVLHAAADRISRAGEPRGCMISVGSLVAGADAVDAVEVTRFARRSVFERLQAMIDNKRNEVCFEQVGRGADLARFYQAVLQGMAAQALDGATAKDLHSIASAAMHCWPE